MSYCRECGLEVQIASSLLTFNNIHETNLLDGGSLGVDGKTTKEPTTSGGGGGGLHQSPTNNNQLNTRNASAAGGTPTTSSSNQLQGLDPILGNDNAIIKESLRGQLSNRIRVAQELFDLLGQVDNLTLPICSDCSVDVLQMLERKLKDLEGEYAIYTHYFDSIKSQQSTTPSRPQPPQDLGELQEKYTKTLALLQSLESQSSQLKQESAAAQKEADDLEAQVHDYWTQVNDIEVNVGHHQEEVESVHLGYEVCSARLGELVKTNVYNDVFRIWHDGPFGTINGLRLGRVATKAVEWSEINAGLGQACLLLDTVGAKISFTFEFHLVPFGSWSRIEKREPDRAVYDLYGSSDIISGMFFANRRLDQGLVAFLANLKGVGEYAESRDPRFKLPYKINKDRIGDASIKIQFNNDEGWTKALNEKVVRKRRKQPKMAALSNTQANIWMISAPSKSSEETIPSLRDRLVKHEYADIFPFSIPDFKVGTLDSLMLLSDELAKMDGFVEAAVIKISDALKGLLNGDVEEWKRSLLVGDKLIMPYLESFSWNTMKYRSDKTLKELADNIVQEVASIDNVMKNKLQAYGVVKTTLVAMQRKTVGNLSVRALNEIVKKEHFVLDSEYLTTLIVAVPKVAMMDWINQYETLTQMVVPRCSQKIAEDDEYALFNVTLFQRVVDEFSNKCREKKFVVRDFQWNAEQLSDEKKKYTELLTAEKDQWGSLLRLCKANFSETFASWQHLKVLRLFIESVLRYGLPPDFQPVLIKARQKQEKKVRGLINKHYAYIDKRLGDVKDDQIDDNLQALMGDKDYAPCVLFAINTIVV